MPVRPYDPNDEQDETQDPYKGMSDSNATDPNTPPKSDTAQYNPDPQGTATTERADSPQPYTPPETVATPTDKQSDAPPVRTFAQMEAEGQARPPMPTSATMLTAQMGGGDVSPYTPLPFEGYQAESGGRDQGLSFTGGGGGEVNPYTPDDGTGGTGGGGDGFVGHDHDPIEVQFDPVGDQVGGGGGTKGKLFDDYGNPLVKGVGGHGHGENPVDFGNPGGGEINPYTPPDDVRKVFDDYGNPLVKGGGIGQNHENPLDFGGPGGGEVNPYTPPDDGLGGGGTNQSSTADSLLPLLTGKASGTTPSELQQATTAKTLEQLKGSSPYGSKEVQDQYNWDAGTIDDQFAQDQRQLDESMAARGLYGSSGKDFHSGRLSDLNVGKRTAKESLARDLTHQYATTKGQYDANAINQGQQGSAQGDAQQRAWMQQLMGYGNDAFSHDLDTAKFQQGQNESEQDFMLRLLQQGYGT